MAFINNIKVYYYYYYYYLLHYLLIHDFFLGNNIIIIIIIIWHVYNSITIYICILSKHMQIMILQ